MFRPRRLGHANLFVSDLERSIQFYHKVCGLEEVFRESAIRAGFLSNGNTHHDIAVVQVTETSLLGRDSQALLPEGWGKRAGLFHLGFEMENEAELVAAYRRARQSEVKILMTVDHQLARSVYLFDPEGNLLEFYADTTKDWRSIFRAYENQLVTGPWNPGEPAPVAECNYPVDPDIRRVADAVFHPRRVAHAALAVRDLEASLGFYCEVAGLQEVVRASDGTFAVLRCTCPGYDLALFQAGADRPVGLHHLGFEMSDEGQLDEAEVQLKRVGIEPESWLDHTTKRSIFLKDPDGILLEYYVQRAPLNQGTDIQPYLA
jgi:catechol 2,3-dioxygenase